MKRIITLLVLLQLIPWSGKGQKIVDRGDQQWVQYYNQSSLSKKWALNFDTGYRWRQGFSSPSQYLIRAGMGYHFNPSLSVAAGFAHLGFYTDREVFLVEFRPYQDCLIRQQWTKVSLQHRFRIEQRIFRSAGSNDDPSDDRFNFRFRYMVQVFVPIDQGPGKPMPSYGVILGNEILVNAGKEIVYNVFDQNRASAGPWVQLNDQLTVNLLYNYFYTAKNAPSQFASIHIIWLQIRHKLDLHQKKNDP